VRWLYHLVTAATPLADPYAPPSLSAEGFIHCSYRDAVAESARLYFPADTELVVLQIDPTLLSAPIRVEATPRGEMPHIHGAVPGAAIVARHALADVAALPDRR
jgi:uncharacterized protein (DUF952 family)